MKRYFEAFLEKIEPVKNALFNKKSAMIFNIFYSVIWNLLLIFTIVFVLVTALGAGVGAGYFASLVDDEKPRSYESMRKDIYNYEEPSEAYFDNGVYLGKMRSDIIREEVAIKDVSKHLINAIIATEDQTFETHNGVVPKAVMRALFQEVTNSANSSGGSTLTQQLVKNQILTSEVSFERKAKEILLALRLENFFDKDEILEAYLNVSSFGRNSSGQNIAGVQAAAKGIFGVEAKDLNLPQAAFIAGLPQSPNGYTPFTRQANEEGLFLKSEEGMAPGLNRQKTVLQRMFETGKITEKEYNDALNYDIVSDFIPPQETTFDSYPALTMETERRAIDILAKQLYEQDGYSEDDVNSSKVLSERYESLAIKAIRQNGYKIYTTIDKDIYDTFNEVVANFDNYDRDLYEIKVDEETGEEYKKFQPVEVGIMLLQNNTGKIISFVGGRDFHRQSQNHATQGGRQNGSTMKPLLVYGPAVDQGFVAPGSIIADVETEYSTSDGTWNPKNVTKRYYGLVTAREALTHSYNVSAIKVLNMIYNHNPKPFEYVEERMKMNTLKGQQYQFLSAALGVADVTVEENTNAFATFANGGQFNDAYMIEKIVDKNGEVIFENKTEPTEVFSPQAAYLTIDMMRDVVQKGTAASIPGQLKFSTDLAGKTGTTNDAKDIWFVGLNPNVTLGIWMGYDHNAVVNNRKMHLQLWAKLMNAVYDKNPELIGKEDRFEMPGGIVKREYCTVSGLLPSEACSKAGLTASDYFIAEHVPTEEDTSLIEGKYVTIDGKNYLAKESTPSEFANTGFILNPEFVEKVAPNLEDKSQLIPYRNSNKWSNIVIPDSVIEENGKVPDSIQVNLSDGKVSWNSHAEKDIVGYYIYRVYNGLKGERVGAIKAHDNLAFTLPDSGYYGVTAVDILGLESKLSNIIEYGIALPPPDDEEDEEEKDKGRIEIPRIPIPGDPITPPPPSEESED